MSATVARLFAHGGSQAVRLPKEFRFQGTEVHIRRVGDEVILSPRPLPSVRSLIEALEAFEPGVQLQREQPPFDERADIGALR